MVEDAKFSTHCLEEGRLRAVVGVRELQRHGNVSLDTDRGEGVDVEGHGI